MIVVENLVKTIRRQKVLKGIDITVQQGSITGIVGRNGAGKTTLLRTIAGIINPTKGNVTFDGKSVYAFPEVKQNIVFVPDTTDALKQYSIKEIVSLYGLIYSNFDSEYFYSLLRRFSMKETGKIRYFSKGQKALFSLILAFSTNAKFLLLDEPTDGLDVIIKKEILRFIAGEVAERDVSVVISSHRLDELEALADHIIVLKDGIVDSHLDMESLKQKYRKLQVAYENHLPDGLKKHLDILHNSGRVYIILVPSDDEETIDLLQKSNPLLYEELPLSLEDIFVAKLGGDSYAS
ncbi:ABC-2 type transport system ATP-binding protein [Salirhabdus euzebyi]|uniref:ABC-2 type transport system ATP-binding protein n=1 Tax=Salirhabdus euzebyi TaxID=394506 RepID=A0A841Q547_9BACI|nr:ABC transporter ATP-binding protein [Salirhabdus euzebyi]MBB6453514.1 ABC-2 type transport system ATP-binding protein [Salirhabdus euzebyi]